MSNPRAATPLLATCFLVLVTLSSCSDAPPGSAPPPLLLTARSAGPDAALAYFEAACAACHDEGSRACLVPGFFSEGRLGPRFDEIPAHRTVAVPEPMRRALRLCAVAD